VARKLPCLGAVLAHPSAPLTRCGALGNAHYRPEEAFPRILGGWPTPVDEEACRRHCSPVPPAWDIARERELGKIALARGTTPTHLRAHIPGKTGWVSKTVETLRAYPSSLSNWQLVDRKSQEFGSPAGVKRASGIFCGGHHSSSPKARPFCHNGHIQPRTNGRWPGPAGRRTPSGQDGLSDVVFRGSLGLFLPLSSRAHPRLAVWSTEDLPHGSPSLWCGPRSRSS
jgi:hypothetical protein